MTIQIRTQIVNVKDNGHEDVIAESSDTLDDATVVNALSNLGQPAPGTAIPMPPITPPPAGGTP